MWRIITLLGYYFCYQFLPVVIYKLYCLLVSDDRWTDILSEGLTIEESIGLTWVGMVAYIVHLLYAKYIHLSRFELHKSRKALFPSVMLALSLIGPVSFLTEWLQLTDYQADYFAAVAGSPLGIILMIALGPLLEELLFRGAILGGLLPLFKSPWPSIIISALLFGVIHLNPAQILPGVLFGIMLGWLFVRTGSLWPGLFAHIGNNALAVVGIYFFPEQANHLIEWLGVIAMWIIVLLSFIIGFMMVRFINNLYKD